MESEAKEDEMVERWDQDSKCAQQLCFAFEKVLLNENWMKFYSDEGLVESDTNSHFRFKKMLLSRYLEVSQCYTDSLEFNSQAVLKSVLANDVDKPMDMERTAEGSIDDQSSHSLREDEVDIE